ncbi:MAG: citrate lyase holo-[acyl-carrier protein] synthase, partial [Lachnospiraceae bacterium]|nr:citrate lyase holo-[acyl-carrier protein] synthase [Lachnospiraceae bacterium]
MDKHHSHPHIEDLYHPITLDVLLSDRDDRENHRKALIRQYKKPLLTFSLNIPYDHKNDNLINFNFNLITSKILFSLSDVTLFYDIKYHDSGDVLYLVFDYNPSYIKTLFTDLEENTSIGRLLDIDIYDTDNKKLSRGTLRKCFLCDKEAFDCARNNTHAKCEINQYIQDALYKNFKDTLSCTMANSLYDELYTTPKPGLVDLHNNGSHKDLDISLLQKSIKTISRYFEDVIEATYIFINQYGYDDLKDISTINLYDRLFQKLQMIGIIIEKNM